MIRYAAFLRAVNVGGTGKLPMADLRLLCEQAGFADVQTYIASGNVALSASGDAAAVKSALEAQLLKYAGKAVAVMVRDTDALDAIIADNPFPEAPGNKVLVMLYDTPPDTADIAAPKGQRDEILACGTREIYVHFPSGQGASRLQLPQADKGTGRNMNTIVKMSAMIRK